MNFFGLKFENSRHFEMKQNSIFLKTGSCSPYTKVNFCKIWRKSKICILRYMRLCKTRFSQKLFHFFLHRGGGGNRIALIFILNDRTENFTEKSMFGCSFVAHRIVAAYECKYFFIINLQISGKPENSVGCENSSFDFRDFWWNEPLLQIEYLHLMPSNRIQPQKLNDRGKSFQKTWKNVWRWDMTLKFLQSYAFSPCKKHIIMKFGLSSIVSCIISLVYSQNVE
jgi:hypothetical protein